MLNCSIWRMICLILFFSHALFFSLLFATESSELDNSELSPEEEFLFSDEEVVVSAARYIQKVTESPSTIYVITAEDIRQSGLTCLPDILRRVPGLDVMTLAATQAEVNIRGIIQAPSNKTLVMIDGLAIYDRGYTSVIWSSLPVVLEDIKRIEVVLGPGSALYGANAYSGLINIITKDPEEAENVHLQGSVGNADTTYSSLLCGGRWDHWGWKMSAGWNQTDRFRDSKNSGDMLRYNYTLEYKENESNLVRFAGGMSKGETEFLSSQQSGAFQSDIDFYYATLSGRWQGLEIMGSYLINMRKNSLLSLPQDYLDPTIDAIRLPSGPLTESQKILTVLGLQAMRQVIASSPLNQRTLNIQGQYTLDRADWYKLICGGSYNNYHVDWGMMTPSEATINEASGFVQAVLVPVEGASFTVGGRFDDYEVVGNRWSYRASLVISKLKSNIFRLSYGTAYRNPSYFENFADLEVGMIGGAIKASGNEDLDAESITTYEAGYQRALYNRRVKLQLNVFFNQIKDFIDIKTMGGVFPVSVRMQYHNVNNSQAIGGELALDMRWSEQFSGFVNYSFQELHFTSEDFLTPFRKENGHRITSAPQHKVNVGVNMHLKSGFSSNLMAHYVSSTNWEWTFSSPLVGDQDDYFFVTGRVAYRFWHERLEAAVSGYNLFNSRQKQFPLGDEPETRVLFTLRIDY